MSKKVQVIVGLAIVIGATIGGGFWATPVVAGALTGPLSVVLTLLVAGVLLLATPIYVTLARIWPKSPGHYYYPTRLLVPENRTVSHLVGWVVNWAAIFVGGFTVTRYMTTAGAEFLNNLVPSISTSVFTMGLITLSFIVIWFGIRTAGRTEVVLSAVLLLAMGVVVIYGFTLFDPSNVDALSTGGLGAVLPAYALLISLGAGPLLAIDISGEVEDPETSIQNIIWTGGAANIGFGALIGLVVHGAVPFAQLEGSTLTTIVQQQYPGAIVLISGVGALLAGVTTNVGYILMVNRYADAASDDGILPGWIGQHNAHGEPWVLLLFMYAMSILAIVVDLPLGAIASGFAFVLLAQATLMFLVGVRLPSKYPAVFEREQIQKSWYLTPGLVRWTSTAGALLTTTVLAYLSIDQQETLGWLVVISAIGVLIYAGRRWLVGDGDLVPSEPDAVDSDRTPN
jgi:APA family basic amino acid/polyamine antiporter